MMTLTGLPILALAAGATVAVAGLTVLAWHRAAQWRIPARVAAILITETLLILTAGITINRAADVYPSWSALSGQTGTTAQTSPRTGRLDQSFVDSRPQPWRPPGSNAWQLSTAPTVTVPAGYSSNRRLTFPVLITLGAPTTTTATTTTAAATTAPAATTAAASIVVNIQPTARTAALPGLPGLLAADLRTAPRGWALVTAAADLPLAKHLTAEFPTQFTAVCVVAPPQTDPFRAGSPRFSPHWADAIAWASAQLPAALAPPKVLPAVVR